MDESLINKDRVSRIFLLTLSSMSLKVKVIKLFGIIYRRYFALVLDFYVIMSVSLFLDLEEVI